MCLVMLTVGVKMFAQEKQDQRAFCKESACSRNRWHDSAKIRDLRRDMQLTQVQLATEVSEHLRELLPGVSSPDLILTQSLVSDLELGRTDLSLLHLYGLSSFFNVGLSELLCQPLRELNRGEVKISVYASQSERDTYLDATTDEHFAVVGCFPSPLFQQPGKSLRMAGRSGFTEVYTLESLVSFLFSPATPYSRVEKIVILEQMISHFSHGIQRRIYFSPPLKEGAGKKHGFQLRKDTQAVLCHMPVQNGAGVLREIQNTGLFEALQNAYMREIKLIQHGLLLLEIARDVLKQGSDLNLLKEINHFYRDCAQRLNIAGLLKSCFSPDIQHRLSAV